MMSLKSTFKWVCVLLLTTASFLASAEPTWIDVRSKAEHKIDNIEGDLLISHTEIVDGVSKLFPNKDQEIRLYCRSGYRASVALKKLEDAGYTNVSNAGGINDARKERKLIEVVAK